MKILFLIMLLFSSTITLAGTIDPDNSDKQYLDYGKKHECVLKLIGHMNDELNSSYSGSCVVIDPYYVITAAHVVANGITFTVIHDGKPHVASIVATHINFKPKEFGSNDISLIKLSTPIKLDFYPDLYKKKDELSRVCSIAGYGYAGTFSTGYNSKKFDNKKRAGSNIINSIRDNILLCSTTDKATTLEFLITPGDSGGGLFIDNKLAGINSCVFAKDGNGNSDYGDESGHTRISDYIEWIQKTKATIEKISQQDLVE